MATKKMKRPAAKAVKKNSHKALKVGAGVAGVAAAIAGAYLMYRQAPESKKKQAKAWIMKARHEAAHEMKKLKHVSAAEYARIIDKAMQRYASMKEVNAPEIMAAAKELKAEWKHIQSEADKAMKMSAPKKKSAPKRKAVTTKRKAR